MEKILVISTKEPSDSAKGGNPRLFELCSRMVGKYQLDLVILFKSSVTTKGELTIFNQVIRTDFFKSATISWKEKLKRYLCFTPSMYPSTKYKVDMLKIRDQIDSLLIKNKYAGIYVDGLDCLPFISKSAIKLAHFDLCDAGAKLKLREAKVSTNIRKRFAYFHEAACVYQTELRTLLNAKSVSFISEEEINFYSFFVKILRPNFKPSVVPQGVSFSQFSYSPNQENKCSLLFFGAFGYHPNVDAALWFATEIFPKVKNNIREVELVIVGKSPPNEVLALSNIEGVKVYADVPQIQPHLESAKIMIVPLRIGAGVKNKILVSAYVGRPIISSKLGTEGLSPKLKENILCAENAEQYVQKINCIFKEPLGKLNERMMDLSKHVSQEYNWEKASQIMINAIIKN